MLFGAIALGIYAIAMAGGATQSDAICFALFATLVLAAISFVASIGARGHSYAFAASLAVLGADSFAFCVANIQATINLHAHHSGFVIVYILGLFFYIVVAFIALAAAIGVTIVAFQMGYAEREGKGKARNIFISSSLLTTLLAVGLTLSFNWWMPSAVGGVILLVMLLIAASKLRWLSR